ncbi:unnamed protein product [Heterosigma akashiwo]|mmetsp:Transcript_44729/g.77213  ORF Transcript_44729/g.77213 Transcript_44729/m.77213 type:complete len:239 (+) Transcript_44729:65-781(+)
MDLSMSLISLFLVVCAFLQLVQSQKFFGVDVDDQKGGSTFQELQEQAKAGGGGLGDLDLGGLMEGLGDVDFGALMAEMMQSPEMQEMLANPTALKEMISEIPFFQNEEMKMMSQYSSQMKELFSDPTKMAEMQEMMAQLTGGVDMEALQKLMTPEGVAEASGELNSFFAEMQEQFKDPATLLKMQEEILNDPALRDSPFFNTPEMKELLDDPLKLAAYLQETLGGAQEWLGQAAAEAA